MTNFLTVNEAAKLIGKSPSSIRRIIYPILENDRHADRHHIEPDAKTAKSLRMKGENFPWKLSEELLRREVPEGSVRSSTESKTITSSPNDGSAALIDLLRGELKIKNEQIATQNELLKGLGERIREGNILVGSLQQQLGITDGTIHKKSSTVEAESAPEKPKQGNDLPDTSSKKTHWLFRKIF